MGAYFCSKTDTHIKTAYLRSISLFTIDPHWSPTLIYILFVDLHLDYWELDEYEKLKAEGASIH